MYSGLPFDPSFNFGVQGAVYVGARSRVSRGPGCPAVPALSCPVCSQGKAGLASHGLLLSLLALEESFSSQKRVFYSLSMPGVWG